MAIRRSNNSGRYFDYSMLFVVVFLIAFGFIMIYSTSAYEAGIETGDAAFYLKKQIFNTVFGMAGFLLAVIIPYRHWAKISTLGYLASLVLVWMVLSPLGVEAKGARRWLNLGFANFQPAEMAKLFTIVFMATFITKIGKKIDTWTAFFTICGIPVPMVISVWLITDNMSSAIIIFGISVVMLFVASSGYKQFFLAGSFVVALAACGVYLIANSLSTANLGFRGERILAWLNPEAYADGKGFQTLQSLYAIGSGGLWGKGLGQSMQKLGFIPEAQNDMIFSIICEELGLFGAMAVMAMFLILIWRMVIIASNCRDLFGALLVVGVLGHIAIQVIFNIAVVTNTMPNTGISLPFISYGGSSVLFLLTEMGIVLNVSKGIEVNDKA